MLAHDLLAVPGVPESAVGADLAASLPDAAPPAPWTVTCEAIVWYARAPRAAVPPEAAIGGRALAVCGGFVQYRDTPVGPYGEVFGGIAMRRDRKPVVTIPFMAVDSPASLVGGRQNWSLPKTLATFRGSPSSGAMVAEGPGWTVRVTARPLGPTLPIRSGGRIAQRFPDGVLRMTVMRARGRVRPALVSVEIESDGPLASWVRPGRHLGAVVPSGTFTFPAAT